MVKGDCGTILVVDDDDSTRLAAVQVAVRLGYDVCAAENAELVLERLQALDRVLDLVLAKGDLGAAVVQLGSALREIRLE